MAAGILIEPPPSEPVPKGIIPEANAADVPPDEPPDEYSKFQGFLVAPKGSLSVLPLCPNSGVFVFPRTTQPACLSLLTNIESSAAGLSLTCKADPKVVTKPLASSRSLTPIGIPARGPTFSPFDILSSREMACFIASSELTAQNALMILS